MHYIDMISSPFFITFYVLAGILLLVLAFSIILRPKGQKTHSKKKILKGIAGDAGVCPVCNSRLVLGEQLKTVLYPGKKDRLCHIFGCPHCHPYKEENIERGCPVCKKTLPQEGYLVARLFNRTDNKKHVHILGCTECRLSSKNDTYRQ